MIVVEDHLNLIFHIANEFKNKKYFRIEYDDLVQIVSLGMVKAAKVFDENRGIKFSPFAYRVCENEVKMYLKSKCTWFRGGDDKYQSPTSLNIKIGDDGNQVEVIELLESDTRDFENTELKILMKQVLDSREYDMISKFYFYGVTQEEIGKLYNLAQTYVSRIIKRGLSKLRASLDINYTHFEKRGKNGRIKILVHNLKTNEKFQFDSMGSASEFIGKHKSYISQNMTRKNSTKIISGIYEVEVMTHERY